MSRFDYRDTTDAEERRVAAAVDDWIDRQAEDEWHSGMYPHRKPYSNKPKGGIPTQMQTLLRELSRSGVEHKLDVTKGGNWYVKLPALPYNVMPVRGRGTRGLRLVKTDGGTLNAYPRVPECLARILGDLNDAE